VKRLRMSRAMAQLDDASFSGCASYGNGYSPASDTPEEPGPGAVPYAGVYGQFIRDSNALGPGLRPAWIARTADDRAGNSRTMARIGCARTLCSLQAFLVYDLRRGKSHGRD
jgi:hypothetical protein